MVKAGGPRCGEQSVGMVMQMELDVQAVTPHQATGRVYQDVVTYLISLGVKALQDSKRSIVYMASHTMTVFNAVIDAEFGLPAHGFIQKA
jgi:hypothetical protein